MLKPLLLLFAVVLFVIAPASTSARPPQTSEAAAGSKSSAKSTAQAQAQAQAQAKMIYGRDCALCHGANGNGKTDVATDMQLTLDDWTNPKTLDGRLDQELFNIIRNGKDKMPSEDKGRASDDEVRNLIIYIRNFAKAQRATAPAAPASPAASTSPAPNN